MNLKQIAFSMVAAAAVSQAATAEFNWSNVSMGGGGFVSAVIASPIDKGLFYARTDVGGAYRWNESTERWESMMDWVDVSERGLLGIFFPKRLFGVEKFKTEKMRRKLFFVVFYP